MSWLRVDDKFTRHPKVLPLSDAAFRLHMTALGYSAEHETDGRVSSAVVETLTRHRNKAPLVEELVKAGLWEPMIGGWGIHDYLDWNPSHAELESKRQAAKQRMNEARSRSVRANKQRTDAEHLANEQRLFAQMGAGLGSGSGSDLGGGAGGTRPANDPLAVDEAALAARIELHPEFGALDARAIAAKHGGHMLTSGQKLEWVLDAVDDCAAKCSHLGLRAEALQARLVGFLRHARGPRESGGRLPAAAFIQQRAKPGEYDWREERRKKAGNQ